MSAKLGRWLVSGQNNYDKLFLRDRIYFSILVFRQPWWLRSDESRLSFDSDTIVTKLQVARSAIKMFRKLVIVTKMPVVTYEMVFDKIKLFTLQEHWFP